MKNLHNIHILPPLTPTQRALIQHQINTGTPTRVTVSAIQKRINVQYRDPWGFWVNADQHRYFRPARRDELLEQFQNSHHDIRIVHMKPRER